MVLRARDEASGVFDKVKSSAGGLASGVGSMLSGFSLVGGAINGVMSLGSAIASTATSMIGGNVEMETYQTQLGTLLGGADAAKERITQLAKIGAETPFDLPQLVAAEKIMAGFGLTTEKTQQLTGKSLDQYRQSIGDMAAATGAPLDEVTLLWSKFGSGATGEAISRLQELGIVTREQMAAMGVEFSKSGELVSPIPEAMTIAMKLADQKMGGGMKALSSTFAGQMSTLADNFGQAKVILMQPIFDVLKTSLAGLNEMLSSEAFTDFVKSLAESGAAAISTMIELGSALGSVFSGDASLESLKGALGILDQIFPAEASDAIINMVYGIGETFRAVMGGDIPGVIAGLEGILEDAGSFIATMVEEWATAFAAWVDGADSGMMSNLGEMVSGLYQWLLESAARIIEKLAVWAGAFVDWIGPKVPGMLAALGDYLSTMLGWIAGTALPFILGKLVEWGAAFVAWIAPRIPPMLAALADLLLQLGGWLISTALPAIVGKLAEWGAAFIAWVAPQIPGLLGALLGLQVALILWIGGQVAAIGAALVAWATAFVEWVATAVSELPGKLAGVLSAITGWIAGAAGGIQAEAASIGAAIINGIANGISAGIGSIRSMAANAANSALEAAKSALGIESPSRVFRDQVGRMIPAGIVEGIDGMRGNVGASLSGLVQPQALRPIASPSYAGVGGGGGTMVTVNVSGSLVAQSDLRQVIGQAVSDQLRYGGRLGRG